MSDDQIDMGNVPQGVREHIDRLYKSRTEIRSALFELIPAVEGVIRQLDPDSADDPNRWGGVMSKLRKAKNHVDKS